ncbi:MAG: hypothetical protein GTO29_03745 [Candidatus Latescibacteria bacterium]|nr:hypothetical protein [Candidatus Latescibacterota bacterium]NIO55189.1 hypothetical protein [Candidatus Latescibacterota bacterium]
MPGRIPVVLTRRTLLTEVAPACAIACLGLCTTPALAASTPQSKTRGAHKFDETSEISISTRQRTEMRYRALIDLIKILRSELEDSEVIRLLNLYSAEMGRKTGERQARNAPDTSFQSFVQVFRPVR